MLAYLLEQDEKCPGCGHPIDETTDDELRHDWEEVALWCNACERKNHGAEVERSEQRSTLGRLWTVRRRR